MRTTHHYSVSEPLSPVHSPEKESSHASFYEVYDIRKRRKCPQ